MNSKAIMAVLAVAFLAVASATCVAFSADDTAADDTQSVTIAKGTSKDVTIRFSESQYQSADYTYSLAWKAAASTSTIDTSSTPIDTDIGSRAASTDDGAGNYTAAGSGSAVPVDDFVNVKLTTIDGAATTVNKYNLNIAVPADATGPIYLVLGCTVTITPDSQSESITLDTFYYSITITVEDASAAMTITGTYEFTQYKDDSKKITAQIGSDDVTVSEYTWYATGLPSGLSMRADGYIVGYPIAATSGAKTVKVTAVDRNGLTVYNTTMSVTVNAPTDSATVTLNVTTSDGVKKIGNTYYVDSGTTIEFTLSTTNNPTGIKVYGIDSNNVMNEISPGDGDAYSVVFNGSGSFQVLVVWSDDVKPNDNTLRTDFVIMGSGAGDSSVSADVVITTSSS